MRRIIIPSLMVVALACAGVATAQKKPKDEVMHAAMMQQFAEVKAALTQLNDRVTALESELAKVRQQQAEFKTELKGVETLVKTTDTSVSNLGLRSEQGILGLQRDLSQIRNEFTNLSDATKRLASASAPGPQGAPAPIIEGYITEVKENEVTISIGSNMNVREGMSFAVFRANDPKGMQIGTIRVKQVLDGTNSRAEIIFKKPEVSAFEFSDVVRQM